MNIQFLSTIAVCTALPLLGSAAFAGPTGTLSGQVRDTKGKPVAGAQVKIIETREMTRTNSSGNYTFAGEDPGVYAIAVDSDKRKLEVLTVTIRPDIIEKLDFILETDASHHIAAVDHLKTSTAMVKWFASHNPHPQQNQPSNLTQETFPGDSGMHPAVHSR